MLELSLDMSTRLLVGDYRTENIRGQVAVKRGPVVYCLESNDVERNVEFENITIDANAEFTPVYRPELLGGVTVLETVTNVVSTKVDPVVGQYRDITEQYASPVKVTLIPYYSWNNREEPKMSVWLPYTILSLPNQ